MHSRVLSVEWRDGGSLACALWEALLALQGLIHLLVSFVEVERHGSVRPLVPAVHQVLALKS